MYVRFLVYLPSKKIVLKPDSVLLLVETGIYFNDLRQKSVGVTGGRQFVLCSKGSASMRITVALTIIYTEIYLPLLLI